MPATACQDASRFVAGSRGAVDNGAMDSEPGSGGTACRVAGVTRAARQVSAWMGISLAEAIAVLDFQEAALGLFDELRVALGDTCAGFWFDLAAPADPRLKIGVVSSGDPPAGARVLAARLILSKRGLVDRADFVDVAIGAGDIYAAFERVSAVLGGTGWFARVSLRGPQFGRGQMPMHGGFPERLWIETVDGLSEEQQGIIQIARAVAGVAIEIDTCLGPGPEFTPLPVRQVQWAPLDAHPDALALLIGYRRAVDLDDRPSLSLDETEQEIRIAIRLPDHRRGPDPDAALPVVSFESIGRLNVKLAQAINGRRITGPGCLLGREQADLLYRLGTPLSGGTRQREIPNTIGLASEDAANLLRMQGFAPRLLGSGPQVIGQNPAAGKMIVGPEDDRSGVVTVTTDT